MNPQLLKAIRLYYGIAEYINPKLAAKKAFATFCTPRIYKVGEKEAKILAEATHSALMFKDRSLKTYEWNTINATQTALLIHGWEGHAGNLGAFVPLLLSKGYNVVAFDAPAHGLSEGKTTNLVDFGEAIYEVLKTKTNVNTVVAHSMGSGALVWALHKHPEINLKQVAMLTTPRSIAKITDDYAAYINLGKKTVAHIFEIVNGISGMHPTLMSVENLASATAINTALIIHDTTDKMIPYYNSEAVAKAWPRATLHTTTGIGHYRMLWHKDVIEKVSDFIN